MAALLSATLALLAAASARAATFDITDYGAIPGDQSVATNNTVAINAALAAASANAGPATIVLIPVADAGPFWALGGIAASNLVNVTVRLDGGLTAYPDYKNWPLTDPGHYAHFIHLVDCVGLSLTGAGTVDGKGIGWWNKEILPALFGKLTAKRPKLVQIQTSTDVLVDGWTLVNSPSFHLLLTDVLRAEVRNVNVVVDREKQRALKAHLRRARRRRRRRRRLALALGDQVVDDVMDSFGAG